MNLKKRAKEKGLNLLELGRILFPGKAESTVSQYMTMITQGKRLSLLTPDRVYIICEKLDLQPEDLGVTIETKQIVNYEK